MAAPPDVAPQRCNRSDRYLTYLVIAVVVALLGAALHVMTEHKTAGTALLLCGDSAFVASLVAYLRQPSGSPTR